MVTNRSERSSPPPMTDQEWTTYSADQKSNLRQRDLELAKEDARRRRIWATGLTLAIDAAVIAAALALLGTVFQTYWVAQANIDLERERFRNTVILKGIEPASLDQSQEYWDFLIRNKVIDTDR